MHIIRLILLPILALILTGFAKAKEWAPETFQLDNGMEVVVLPDHRAPVVTHMLWYRVGAADEVPGKSGIAHLFEHLMFKATDKIPAGEFSKIVARNGGQDNAFTSFDYTAYYQRVAKDRLKMMMEMEANRMINLILSDEEVLPERDVVKEERRQRTDNNPGAILFEKVLGALYHDHPYSIPVIGHMEEVAQLTRQDALDFYAKWYGPENTILVVAGDITADELSPLAKQIYGAIPPKGDLQTRSWPDVVSLSADAFLSHSDPKVRQPVWSRYWLATSYMRAQDNEAHALDVAIQILGGGQTSRLYQRLVEEEKLAVSAYAWAWTDLRAEGLINIGATPANGVELAQVEAVVMEVLDDFLKNGPTEEELARVKSSFQADYIFARDNQMEMAYNFAKSMIVGHPIESILGWPDAIAAVSAEDVVNVSRKYLDGTHHVTTHLLPEGS